MVSKLKSLGLEPTDLGFHGMQITALSLQVLWAKVSVIVDGNTPLLAH